MAVVKTVQVSFGQFVGAVAPLRASRALRIQLCAGFPEIPAWK